MNDKPFVVGICGYKGSGKSVAAKAICALGFERHRFAGPLKSGLKVMFGLGDEHVDGDFKEVPTDLLCGETPRRAMTTLGTEWGREIIDKEIWTTAWRNTMPKGKNIVVDDMRFPNEAKLLREDYGARLIRVVRPSIQINAEHESEAHVMALPVDITIVNDGTVEELFANVQTVVEHWITGGK